MPDVLSPEQRRYCMSRIRGADTKPELIVRSLVHRMGYRFRLHVRDLPGKPDIVLRRLRKVIFVHGCYWHNHSCKYGRVQAKTNAEFWASKRQSNVERDQRNIRQLKQDGWQVLVIWECTTRTSEALVPKLESFLKDPNPNAQGR